LGERVRLAASGQLINPDYLEAIGWPAGAGVVTTIVIVVVLLLSSMDAVDGLAAGSRLPQQIAVGDCHTVRGVELFVYVKNFLVELKKASGFNELG
jgi:hypothetical protein